MELEDQVVSLELAKKLKEAGVKQESYFVWAKLGEMPEKWNVQRKDTQYPDEYAAFTVAELGEMLPAFIRRHDQKMCELWLKREQSRWLISYRGYVTLKIQASEADARADMLLYLIENGLVKNSSSL